MKLRHLSARLFFSAAILTSALTPPALIAQQGSAAEIALQEADRYFDASRYSDAVTAYSKILTDYPTSPYVPIVNFRLGQALFMEGQYDKSLEALAKVTKPPASEQVQEQGFALVPQVIAAKASKEENKAQQKAGYEEAIKQYDHFIATFPNSEQIEQAAYGRALANLQIENYEEAVKNLRDSIARFAKSDTIQDSEYLLALILATQGSLAKQSDPKSTDGEAKYNEALQILESIIAAKKDVALMNDARFQIGELHFYKGSFAESDEQKAIWNKAIEAYRDVQPKAPMIRAQEARYKDVVDRKLAAGRGGNLAEFRRLGARQDVEANKLESVKAKEDLTISSKLKLAQIFFYLGQYDEARVILRYFEPRVENDDHKRDIAYFITSTYASQKQRDKAVEAYDKFQSAYKGASMADSLPLSIGSLFLSVEPPDPEKAIQYFQESVQIYPKGRFLNDSLTQQAMANVQLRRFDQALKVFQEILKTNPKPELAAQAEYGIATIYKDTQEIDKAIAAFRKVREQFPGTPEAENSSFWVSQLVKAKGQFDEAEKELNAFMTQYPKSTLFPAAKYYLGEVERDRNNLVKAEEIFRQVAAEYPESEVAPFTYFQRANLFGRNNELDKVVAILREFITKYPQSPYIFSAFDTIAKSLLGQQKPVEATAAYSEFVTQYPQDTNAPDALKAQAEIWYRYSVSLGRFQGLNEEQQAEWKKATDACVAAAEKLLTDYPESPKVVNALEEILATKKLSEQALQSTPAQIISYFEELSGKFTDQPATKNKVLFTLASYLHESDKAKALELMTAAYDPALTYSPTDLDLYGIALLENGKADESQKVYEKLAADFPNPEGIAPDKAPRIIQEAQSISLYGRGKVLQTQGNVAAAGELFDELKKLYPWSPKVLEANYGIAAAMVKENKLAEAPQLLISIIRAPTASAELRARASFLNGEIFEARSRAATKANKPADAQRDLASAIDQFAKIGVFYSGVDRIAAEGLWRAGQLLEEQARTLPAKSDKQGPTAGGQRTRALTSYRELVQKYPNSPRAAEASERVKALTPAR